MLESQDEKLIDSFLDTIIYKMPHVLFQMKDSIVYYEIMQIFCMYYTKKRNLSQTRQIALNQSVLTERLSVDVDIDTAIIYFMRTKTRNALAILKYTICKHTNYGLDTQFYDLHTTNTESRKKNFFIEKIHKKGKTINYDHTGDTYIWIRIRIKLGAWVSHLLEYRESPFELLNEAYGSENIRINEFIHKGIIAEQFHKNIQRRQKNPIPKEEDIVYFIQCVIILMETIRDDTVMNAMINYSFIRETTRYPTDIPILACEWKTERDPWIGLIIDGKIHKCGSHNIEDVFLVFLDLLEKKDGQKYKNILDVLMI